MKRIFIILILIFSISLFSANVRWKDKANLAGANIADDDYMPITDKSASNADKHVTPDDLATYLEGKLNTATMTLTNKTINSDNNTITNIVNADIKAGAAIAMSKLAALTASRVVITDGSGFLTQSDVTSTELDNALDGITATATELNLCDADAITSIYDSFTDIRFKVLGTVELDLSNAALYPQTSAGLDLGTSGNPFDDLFLDGDVDCDNISMGGDLTCLGGANFDNGVFTQAGGNATFNDDGISLDFIVKSQNNDDMIYVDGSADMVGIATASPTCELDIDGTLRTTEIASGLTNFVTSSSVSDTYVATPDPAYRSYPTGMTVIFTPTGTSNTGACTLNINGLGAKSIILQSGLDPANGDIKVDGVHILLYNGTRFEVVNPY